MGKRPASISGSTRSIATRQRASLIQAFNGDSPFLGTGTSMTRVVSWRPFQLTPPEPGRIPETLGRSPPTSGPTPARLTGDPAAGGRVQLETKKVRRLTGRVHSGGQC